MKLERFNEILTTLITTNENLETAKLLQELKEGYNENSYEKEYNELKEKYDALEKEYIDTFKNTLTEPVETPVETSTETVEVEEIHVDDLFTSVE